jgi:hypothetical protein
MPDPPPSPSGRARHGRHEGPGLRRRDLVVSWLLGFSWFAGCVVAFFIGFGLTGVSPTPLRPPLDRAQQPGFGAALVGLSAAFLVFLVGAQISILRDQRRHPKAGYKALHWRRYLPPSQALRHNARLALICIPMTAAGLWLRHYYG